MSAVLHPTDPGTTPSPGRSGRADLVGPAEGLELLGIPDGSGREQAPGLVRRADGQVLQLTPLLYRVLEALDGRRDDAQVAAEVAATTDTELDADDVRYLVDERLHPIGVLDGAQPTETVRANPLLALRLRYVVTDPERTRRITAPFAALFHPVVVALVLGGFLGSAGWLAVHRGLAQAARQAVYQPGWLLAIIGLTLLSAGFHEFGHAAAVRYAGGTPGSMGVGLYLLWPAFFTDVTDSYRFPRRDRLRVDLGGLYFNAVFGVAVMLLWAATGTEALLLLFAGQILQMARQLLPFLRYDGYHVLADLTGVPDLFQQIGPTLSALHPRNWGRPSPSRLRRGARITVLVWTAVTIPLLGALLVMLLLSLPRVLATSADAAVQLGGQLRTHVAEGSILAAVLEVVQLAVLGLVPAGAVYLLWRLGRQAWTWAVRHDDATTGRRVGAAAVLAGLLALVVWALAPDDDWRPLRTTDRGRLDDLVTATQDTVADALGAGAVRTQGAPLRGTGAARPASPASDATADLGGTPPPGDAGGTSVPDGGPPAGLVATATDATTDAVDDTVDDALPTATGTVDGLVDDVDVDVAAPLDAPALPTPDVPTDEAPTPPAVLPEDRVLVTSLPEPWPFRFSLPTAGRDIDNVNVAAVGEDATAMRSFSTELVVAAPGTVDHRNEAFAFARCTDCGAAAASFQVVLLPDEHRVIVPRNLAGAVNEDCERCDVTAVANQLVVSVVETPSPAVIAQIQAVLDGLAPLEQQLGRIPATELRSHFYDAQRAVLRILADADPTTNVTPDFQTEAAVADDGQVTTDRTGAIDPTGAPTPEAASETPAPGTGDEPTAPQPVGADSHPEAVAVEPEQPALEEQPGDGTAAAPPPDDLAPATDPSRDSTTEPVRPPTTDPVPAPTAPSSEAPAVTSESATDEPAGQTTDEPLEPAPEPATASGDDDIVAREEDLSDPVT